MMATPAFAESAGAAGSGDIIMQMVPFIAMIAIFYFLLIRPQQRRAKEHKAKIESVRRGDQIVTAGGIMGKVVKVNDADVEIEIAENVRVNVVKQTLADVVSKSEPVKGEKS
ncbi:MAG TPA: preprotein translocase subunit YajC [Alphaproteobacteria bacterium]|nr:preprotein translocase subunit YajC [Alphaproteobacteria bacterium]